MTRKINNRLDFQDYYNYCLDNYDCIGEGSSRIVFRIGDIVAKLALNNSGIIQNLCEIKTYKKSRGDEIAEKYLAHLLPDSSKYVVYMEYHDDVVQDIPLFYDEELEMLTNNFYNNEMYFKCYDYLAEFFDLASADLGGNNCCYSGVIIDYGLNYNSFSYSDEYRYKEVLVI